MAGFTKTQQRNGTNCEFENYVTPSNYFVLNSLDKSHLNSVCIDYVCDKSENTRVCAKWQWNALDWCYWIALPASPVVQSSNTVSCVSLSFRTHPYVLAINTNTMMTLWHGYSFWITGPLYMRGIKQLLWIPLTNCQSPLIENGLKNGVRDLKILPNPLAPGNFFF